MDSANDLNTWVDISKKSQVRSSKDGKNRQRKEMKIKM